MIGTEGKYVKRTEITTSLGNLAQEFNLIANAQFVRQLFEVLLLIQFANYPLALKLLLQELEYQ